MKYSRSVSRPATLECDAYIFDLESKRKGGSIAELVQFPITRHSCTVVVSGWPTEDVLTVAAEPPRRSALLYIRKASIKAGESNELGSNYARRDLPVAFVGPLINSSPP